MKNLLILSFFPAFVPPQNGGEVRLFNFYFGLSKYYNITLLSSGHLNADLETIWHTNNFVEKRVPKGSEFANQWQLLSPYAGEGDLSGPCCAACGPYATELHAAYLESYQDADIIIHDSPFTVDYDLFIGLDNKLRVYNSYNCEYELYKKLHSTSPSPVIIDLVHSAELKLLKYVDLISYCGEADLPAFSNMLPKGLPPTIFIPNGMTLISTSKTTTKISEKIKRAVFIGSAHLPNVEAAESIVKSIAPSCPDVMFDIIGTCLSPGVYPHNVIRHGAVDPRIKSELIDAADIAIIPMKSGSGSSLKILDFVSFGKPVLSTPIGIRGFDFLDGVHCLVAEIEEFPRVINDYSNKTELLAEMGISARMFAHEHYSWSAIASRFNTTIRELSEKHHSRHLPYVLALNDYDPFETIGGGATRLQGIYSAIIEWANVVVLCFAEEANLDVVEVSSGITRIRVPKSREHIEEEVSLNSQYHISVNDIVAFRHAAQNTILTDVYDVLRKNARIILCEHPYMSSLPISFGDRFVYSSQNFEYGLKESLLEWHPHKLSLLNDVHFAERSCISNSAAIVAVSAEDAENFTRNMNLVAPVVLIPNGAGKPVPPTSEDVTFFETKIKSRSAVFLGSAHMPNVDAAKFIIENLALACPNVDFHIIGSVCQTFSGVIPQNVTMWGILSDSQKSAVLQRCLLAINPMFSGSGSNVKLADFLANGLHVVSTPFGVRGYPDEAKSHVTICEQDMFATTLKNMINVTHIGEEAKRSERRLVFEQHLSMQTLASQFVNLLKNLETPKYRMLFVTYRYTSPAQGGAESMLEKLIAGVSNSNKFSIDVVASEISSISENSRFASHYVFDSDVCAPTGSENVRYVRFPVIKENDHVTDEMLAVAWRAQSEFEKQFYNNIKSTIAVSGLAWGWGYPEGDSNISRWGFTECGLHLACRTTVNLAGFVPRQSVIRVCDADGTELLHQKLESHFEITFEANAGTVAFYISVANDISLRDHRPLGMYVRHIFLNTTELNLSEPTILRPMCEDALQTYLLFNNSAMLSRSHVNLTAIRGPSSPALESYLEKQTKYYDIVVTHNSVFRPAVAAISAAKASNIPSILIPHAHLDDDFYHFPDVHQCALDATLVLSAPKAACQFYESIGAKQVAYLPAGIDVSETFSDEDENNFKTIYTRNEPFFLILGRKASAKGYMDAIKAIERLACKHRVHLVLIGPDDDGVPITSANATYLGPQPRNVVRGALRSCIGLINMSASESFGIVLLEAWLAGRPVIANFDCSAFHDLAIHEENALLISKDKLEDAMARLLIDPDLCNSLGGAGRRTANNFSWEEICSDFISKCIHLVQ